MKNNRPLKRYGFITVSIFLLFTFTFLLVSCNTTGPKPERDVVLKVEDVSSTEAWLKLSLNNFTTTTQVQLKRNGKAVNTFTITSRDTTLYDNSLNPNSTYTYQAIELQNGKETAKSELVSVQTMDTTSHNFTWQTYTFGGANGSSALYDVAIINDSDIWAVGEIHTAETDQWNSDSTKWIQPYNAVHWDGQKWELKRIFINNYFYPLYVVFAFSEDDIWFGNLSMIHWNGDNTSFYTTPKNFGRINAMWGTSSKNFYVVGNNGNIAHYDGSKWTKIESPEGVNGTDLNINDIWGDYNKETGKWEILAVASNIFSSLDRKILSIDPTGGKVTQISSQRIGHTLRSVWFVSQRTYYVAGGGIYQKHNLSDKLWKHKPYNVTSDYYTNKIRGDKINDLVAVGGFGEVLHFNGITWKSYFNETQLQYGNYYSTKIKNNLIVAVGDNAVITIGKR